MSRHTAFRLLLAALCLPRTAYRLRPAPRLRGNSLHSSLALIGYYVKMIMYSRVKILIIDEEWRARPKASVAGDQVVATVTAFVTVVSSCPFGKAA
jgi:hypothetical protein